MNRLVPILALFVAGCVAHHTGAPEAWFADRDAVMPRGNKVSVCHAFGCQFKTTYAFSDGDIRYMQRKLARARSAEAEREAIKSIVSWAEKRVAPTVGSAHDVGGLDMQNAGKRGQMDCIDEAANTTSYLMVAANNGLLRYHTVASPVARGFFLDGRYPHATAVVADKSGKPWAVDSWPEANGVPPKVIPLEQWFEESPAR